MVSNMDTNELAQRLRAEAWGALAGSAWRNWTYNDLAEMGPGTLAWSMKERVDNTLLATLRTLETGLSVLDVKKDVLRELAEQVKRP